MGKGRANSENQARKPASTIVPWLALGISVMAFTLSALQFRETLRQNDLIVSPALSLWSKVGNLPEQGIYLSNRGFGPARLTKFQVRYRGRDFGSFAAVMTYLLEESERDPSDLLLTTGLDPKTVKSMYESVVHQSWKAGDILEAKHESALFLVPAGVLPTPITSAQLLRKDLVVEVSYCSLRNTYCQTACLNRKCPEPRADTGG